MMRLLLSTLALVVSYYQTNALNQITQMGVCENRMDGALRCAMQPSDCKPSHIDGSLNIEGEIFLGVHQQNLQNKNLDCKCEDTPTHLCLTPLADDPSKFKKTCVPDVSDCDLYNGSLLGGGNDYDKHCTCSHILDVNDGNTKIDTIVGPTMYGACMNIQDASDFFCAVAPTDCTAPYDWVKPEDTQDVVGTQCTCDKVRTGACVSGFAGTVCSVSAEACGDARGTGSYFPPLELKEKHGESCRLCSESTIGLEIPSDAIDSAQQEVPLLPILGGSIAGVLLLLGCAICFKRWNSGRKQQDTITEDHDAESVETPQVRVEDEGSDMVDVPTYNEPTLKEIT